MPELRSIAWRQAAVTTATAVVLALLPTTVVLLLGGAGILSAPVWASRLWLFAVGGGLTAGGVSFASVPLAGLLLAFACAYVASRRTVPKAHLPHELTVYAAVCGGFGAVFAAVLSVATSIGDGGTSMVRSALGAFVVVGGGVALDLMHRAGKDPWVGKGRLASMLRAAARGFVALCGASFVVLMVLLLTSVGEGANLWASLHPTGGGVLALAVLVLLAVPTMLAWTMSVLLGPGFSLGTNTHVDLTGVDVGHLPIFPALAALPSPGPFGSWVIVFALIPVLAGIWAGWTSHRADGGLLDVVADGAGAGALAGGAAGLMLALSAGPIGPGSLAVAGPSVASSILVAVVTLAVGGALGALGAHYRGARGV